MLDFAAVESRAMQKVSGVFFEGMGQVHICKLWILQVELAHSLMRMFSALYKICRKEWSYRLNVACNHCNYMYLIGNTELDLKSCLFPQ